MEQLRVGLIGYGKMGRAHSQAYATVSRFFDHRIEPVNAVLCGRNLVQVEEIASRFGWQSVETDWRRLVEREDVDLIDICAPTRMHEEVALAAAQRSKHVFCEKPLALTSAGAEEMLAHAERNEVKHMVTFNYRFIPAVRLAKRLISEGRLGDIRHFRGAFYQDWRANPEALMTWRLRSEEAGSGALGDLGAHVVDLALYLVGEIEEVSASMHAFVPRRRNETGEWEDVTVDDAFEALARFRSGASGVIEASRFAPGHKCSNRFEVNGSKGSLRFDFERMNELSFFSAEDDTLVQGFRTVTATVPKVHPYADHWWGPGHVIGFEETFVHQTDELLSAFEEERQPVPNFHDGLKCQQVLDAISESSRERCWVRVET